VKSLRRRRSIDQNLLHLEWLHHRPKTRPRVAVAVTEQGKSKPKQLARQIVSTGALISCYEVEEPRAAAQVANVGLGGTNLRWLIADAWGA
jgi:hypothetical protein